MKEWYTVCEVFVLEFRLEPAAARTACGPCRVLNSDESTFHMLTLLPL